MPLYEAYGLTVDSALPLPGLPAGVGKADVFVRVVRHKASTFPEPTPIRCSFAEPNRAQLSWAGVGDLLIEHGNSIQMTPIEGAEEEALRLFLLGAGFGVLQYQRGFLVLHGSGVAIGDRAVGFVGPKGFGKSTTAASLHQRGHSLIADELLVLRFDESDRAVVVPGPPQIRLWSDALAGTGRYVNDAVRVRAGIEKFSVDVKNATDAKLPVHRIYVLDAGQQLSIEPMSTKEALFGVIPHLYVHRFGTPFIQATGASRVFRQIESMLKKVAVKRLVRKRDLYQLPEIAALVEADVMEHQGVGG
jgi:hypothetical protein